MAKPETTEAVELLSYQHFKRSAGVAVKCGKCVACKKPARKRDFFNEYKNTRGNGSSDDDAQLKEEFKAMYDEYREDGLCFRCNIFLNTDIRLVRTS